MLIAGMSVFPLCETFAIQYIKIKIFKRGKYEKYN